MMPSIIILTFNSAESIQATIESARFVSDDIWVVDSASTDTTILLAKSLGAQVVQHGFEDYSIQRNWAIDSLSIRYAWQLHLDADEIMDHALREAIKGTPEDSEYSGFLIPRFVKFLGRVMKHGGMSPTWHLRLFRSGIGRCEDRKYDQHFYLIRGSAGSLRGCLIDDIRMPLSEWTARHNKWSDQEVSELTAQAKAKQIQPRLTGNAIERKRFWRASYQKVPLFVRPLALFFYRYMIRLGCLDGKEGLIFWFLQTFWFRFLIDAKLFEHASRLPRPEPVGIERTA